MRMFLLVLLLAAPLAAQKPNTSPQYPPLPAPAPLVTVEPAVAPVIAHSSPTRPPAPAAVPTAVPTTKAPQGPSPETLRLISALARSTTTLDSLTRLVTMARASADSLRSHPPVLPDTFLTAEQLRAQLTRRDQYAHSLEASSATLASYTAQQAEALQRHALLQANLAAQRLIETTPPGT